MKEFLPALRFVLVLGCLLCCGVAVSGVYAQDQLPRLFDSYGVVTGTSEAEMARLDNFDFEVKKDSNSKVYIVGYNGRDDAPGKARRYTLRAKTYLVEVRGVEPSRIVTVEGGRREEFVVELWIVPPGTNAPSPTPTILEVSDLGDNLLYDEYSLGYDSFGKYEDATARLDGFAAALKKEPAAWGCIIAFGQNGDDKVGIECIGVRSHVF